MPEENLYDEKELLIRVAANDRTAYTILYNVYYPKLYQYLFFATRSKEDAEEILQDVFLKAWVKRATLPAIQSINNYFFRMARNRLIDYARRHDLQTTLPLLLPPTDLDDDSVFKSLLLKEYNKIAQQAIEFLPERRRTIFLLNAQDELTAREIAERMGMSLAAVQKHLYEASHFIRDYLQKHADLLPLLFLFIVC